jgi:hypothetical protein
MKSRLRYAEYITEMKKTEFQGGEKTPLQMFTWKIKQRMQK